MDFKKRLLPGIAYNTFGNIINQSITLMISVLLARSLKPEEFGNYFLLVSIPMILYSLTSLGYVQSINRFLPELKGIDKIHLIPRLLKYVVKVKIISISIIFILFVLLNQKIFSIIGLEQYRTISVLICLTSYFIIININSILNVLFVIKMEQRRLNVLDVCLSVLKLITIAILIVFNELQIIRIIGLLIVLDAMKCIYLSFNYSEPGKVNKDSSFDDYLNVIRRFNKYSFLMYLIQLSGMILAYRSDIYFIGFYLTSTAVANYMIATTLTTQAYSLIGTVSTGQMIFSAMVESYKLHGQQGLIKYFQYHVTFTALYTLPIMLGGIILSSDLIVVLFGTEYMEVIYLLMVALVFHGLLNFGGAVSAVLATMEKPHYFLWTKALIFVNIILNIILIPWLGALGAVIATGITKLIILAIEIWLTKRLINISLPINLIFRIIVACLIMGAIMYFSGALFHESIPRMFIQFSLGFAVYAILVIRFNIIPQDIIKFLPITSQSIIQKIKM